MDSERPKRRESKGEAGSFHSVESAVSFTLRKCIEERKASIERQPGSIRAIEKLLKRLGVFHNAPDKALAELQRGNWKPAQSYIEKELEGHLHMLGFSRVNLSLHPEWEIAKKPQVEWEDNVRAVYFLEIYKLITQHIELQEWETQQQNLKNRDHTTQVIFNAEIQTTNPLASDPLPTIPRILKNLEQLSHLFSW